MELTWPQFRSLNNIRILTEQEQIRQYYSYLDSLANERLRQNKGPILQGALVEPFSGYLLQENFDYILQEDGSRIYL